MSERCCDICGFGVDATGHHYDQNSEDHHAAVPVQLSFQERVVRQRAFAQKTRNK